MNIKSMSPHMSLLKCYRYKSDSEFYLKYLHNIQKKTGVIKDRVMEAVMHEQGFDFDDQTAARSKFDPASLFTSLKGYDSTSVFNPDKKTLSTAYLTVEREISHLFGTLSTMSEISVVAHLAKSKSAGAPFFQKKDVVLEQSGVDLINAHKHPCVAYYRTQSRMQASGDFKPTVRLVWGYPMDMTVLEGKYARPLINAFKTANTSYVIGLRKFEMGARLQHFQWAPFVGSFDWSKFDSTIPAQIMSMVFKLLKKCFHNVDNAEWERIVRYFIHTPILMPNGKVYIGKVRGIPSGSYFTNIVGSLANLLLIRYLQASLGLKVRNICVHGDDSIVACNSEMPLKQMSDVALKSFGMVLHPDKQRYTKTDHELEFLSHMWKGARPYRAVRMTAQQAIYTERGYPRDEDPGKMRFIRICQLYGDNHLAWPLVHLYLKRANRSYYGPRDWIRMVTPRPFMRGGDDVLPSRQPLCLNTIL